MIPGAINNECVAFSIIEIEKLCKENTECKAEQAYVRNQKPVPMIHIKNAIKGKPSKDADGNPAGKGHFHNTSDDPNAKFKFKMGDNTK